MYVRTLYASFLILSLIFLGGCKGKGVDPLDGMVITMDAPYLQSSDITSIPEGFSAVGNAPWGIIHNGIDFLPAKNLTTFRSVSAGVVSDISMWKNEISLKWQVNVRVRFNSTYTLEYIFETFSSNQADGQAQLSYLNISVGKTLAAGDPIGQLFTAGSGSHLHLML